MNAKTWQTRLAKYGPTGLSSKGTEGLRKSWLGKIKKFRATQRNRKPTMPTIKFEDPT